jgi:hypothetical protein
MIPNVARWNAWTTVNTTKVDVVMETATTMKIQICAVPVPSWTDVHSEDAACETQRKEDRCQHGEPLHTDGLFYGPLGFLKLQLPYVRFLFVPEIVQLRD